ncbi:MAG: DUF4143 domain-containing protein [Thermoanaerobaculia bacterium]
MTRSTRQIVENLAPDLPPRPGAPKVSLCDSALVAHLLGLTADRLSRDPQHLGRLLENFVAMELRKQATWAETPVSVYHYRTAAGREVDLILEDSAGRIVGVEVKASTSFGKRDTAGLRALAEDLGARFHRGALLYGGETVVPIGAKIDALPVSALWCWS